MFDVGQDQPVVSFHGLLEQRFNIALKKFEYRALTPELMRQIYAEIRWIVDGVFSVSRHKLSREATTWLANQYFKSIKINDDQLMDDNVVFNEYNLSELEATDIQLLYSLFHHTRLGQELADELRTRNAS